MEKLLVEKRPFFHPYPHITKQVSFFDQKSGQKTPLVPTSLATAGAGLLTPPFLHGPATKTVSFPLDPTYPLTFPMLFELADLLVSIEPLHRSYQILLVAISLWRTIPHLYTQATTFL